MCAHRCAYICSFTAALNVSHPMRIWSWAIKLNLHESNAFCIWLLACCSLLQFGNSGPSGPWTSHTSRCQSLKLSKPLGRMDISVWRARERSCAQSPRLPPRMETHRQSTINMWVYWEVTVRHPRQTDRSHLSRLFVWERDSRRKGRTVD